VRSGHYRPLFRKFFWFGLIPCVLILGWMGGLPAEEPYVMISQVASIYYFAHFLIILPIVSAIERPEPMPFSITEAVLGKDDKALLSPTRAGDAPPPVQPVPAA
jgi:ubiquinol-cytochrome c reductase cytochrome b subunit